MLLSISVKASIIVTLLTPCLAAEEFGGLGSCRAEKKILMGAVSHRAEKIHRQGIKPCPTGFYAGESEAIKVGHGFTPCRLKVIRRARLLLSREENRLNVGRGFIPRRENSSAGFKTLPYKKKFGTPGGVPSERDRRARFLLSRKGNARPKNSARQRRALQEISEGEVPAEPKILVPFTLEGACLSFRVRTSESPSRAGRCLKVSCLPS